MTLEKTSPEPTTPPADYATVSEFDAWRTATLDPGRRPGPDVPRGPFGERTDAARLWNTGVKRLTNNTRRAGEPPGNGVNLYYDNRRDASAVGNWWDCIGFVPKAVDQRPNTNFLDVYGNILPWCINSKEVREKGCRIFTVAEDLQTLTGQCLYLFQYYRDDTTYFLPAGFTYFDERVGLGEGPSSYLDIDFEFDGTGMVVARGRAV